MPVLALHCNADHPVFAGHFPGNPIVPGVLLLDWAQTAIESDIGQRVHALSEAKFHHPAKPTDTLALEFEISGAFVRFEVRSATHRIASGRFSMPVTTSV